MKLTEKPQNTLRGYRMQANMTQLEVSIKLRVTQQAVSLWEMGTTPTDYYLNKLAKLYKVTVDKLKGKEDKL